MSAYKYAKLIFPHQLFAEQTQVEPDVLVVLVEDDLFFRQYPFHVQKLILHRASMRQFEANLKAKKLAVEYIATDANSASIYNLKQILRKHEISKVIYYDVVDDWLEQRLQSLITELKIAKEMHPSPSFLTTTGQIEDFFANNPNRMQSFYAWQRKRLNILIQDNGKPVGDKWSFDAANRKKIPKNTVIPKPYVVAENQTVEAAKKWVRQDFADNPGNVDTFAYPTNHAEASKWLDSFLKERFDNFGPYEDAIVKDESQLFHSILSSLINTGLLMPQEVVEQSLEYALKHDVAIESLEGFIRQIIGWREYMRATYVLHGRRMRVQNNMKLNRKLTKQWWNATTGLEPVDITIKRLLNTGYSHHIERLMVLGNAMLLMRYHPDDVYVWFMSMYIDAYDWVMVPNVYAMSQYAADNLITTKPYVSGSNYLRKMSDFPAGEWTAVWDALYWQFVADYKPLFAANYRSAIMVHLYDSLSADRKNEIKTISAEWLKD